MTPDNIYLVASGTTSAEHDATCAKSTGLRIFEVLYMTQASAGNGREAADELTQSLPVVFCQHHVR